MDNLQRHLPSIKTIQDSPAFQHLLETAQMDTVYLTMLAKRAVQKVRERIAIGRYDEGTLDKESLLKEIMMLVEKEVGHYTGPSIRKVINGTGVVLHTNLGRARLGEKVVRAVGEVASNYSDLEFDLESGGRGSRYDRIENLLKLITGAEAAMVVNNNAAAVFLILRALAKNKEVIVSRGELVEIGGSFRVSSIMEESDAQLVEVGTTNKTHANDYTEAITDQTAMLLKVHRSNFNITGFTSEVPRNELAEMAKHHRLIFYEDLGSGAFVDFKDKQIGQEPIISDLLKAGADLVSASGDKLFGGPQAGIILGKKALIEALKKHQLTRTFRVDKMTLAALTATLQHYLSSETLSRTIPTIRDITEDVEDVRKRADCLATRLETLETLDIKVIQTKARVGGGTMPEVTLESVGLVIQSRVYSAEKLARKLRTGIPAVVGRIDDDHFILDIRTIADDELDDVVTAFQFISGSRVMTTD